ncbi:ATP-dependent DNA helicase RecG [Sediminivirga luteola]|uniref:Probable DNA 3'-5' helicase RecG n=1 Tax=Sediminivirga luteola TaxID=1774748 RepID=A0A8J2XIW9_9MICO|nr:ATP-dependent DNA helicase RecG [Sediminivirga luteola]MCI2264599.1 ATP-dependent DNA helicase RecG [Sediminivirga luteola]GGA03122.1 ATP-dependent DNA helicase RecG [Sediminivirga luteola]
MTATEKPFLDRSLSAFVPPRQAKAFREAGLATAGALLRYFPRRYIDPGELTDLAGLEIGVEATVQGRIVSVGSRRMHSRRGHLTEVRLRDDSGAELTATFFNQPWLERKLTGRRSMVLSGKTGLYRGKLQLASPRWLDEPGEVALDEESALEVAIRPTPLYPATADLSTKTVMTVIRQLLELILVEPVDDPLPAPLRRRHGYPELVEALRLVHTPATMEDAHRGLARFRFEEAFALQTVLARRRADTAAASAVPRPLRPEDQDSVLRVFDEALPFTLTAAQRRAGEEIGADLARESPMNRLLHGEVGAGKTLVALRAMLQTVDAGGQAVLLAPTEVLAAQHFASLTGALGELGDRVKVVLLTGSMPQALKRQALLDIVTGEADIVVGTHALLEDRVSFFQLGLVVVDEQHRFGVDQREALRGKGGDAVPHTLVMTATPIPRTVAMTVFGDLDVSVLDELPSGRRDISTHAVPLGSHPHWMERVWQRLAELVDAGQQVYIVVPRIGDEAGGRSAAVDGADEAAGVDGVGEPPGAAEATGAKGGWGVQDALEAVLARPEFNGRTAEIMHGRLRPEEKDAVMGRFARGEVDVLVATTVIEVGVDVRNATGMLVLDANRFGIAQLHQIRGRVGRGGQPGLCFLVTEDTEESEAFQRLSAVAGSNDGFELSELDVRQRREGDVLGRDQSGRRSGLKLLSVIDDHRVLARAREEAVAIVAEDPGLEAHPALAALCREILSEDREQYIDLA